MKCLDRVMDELVPTLTGLYAAAGAEGTSTDSEAEGASTTTTAGD